MPQVSEAQAGAAMRVLLIDRDTGGAAAIAEGLAQCFAQTPDLEVAASGRAGSELLRRRSQDLVLADLASLADLAAGAEDAVARLAKLAGEALTIVLSEESSVSAAVAAMRAGAHDYVAKPVVGPAFAARIAALALRHGKALDLKPAAADVAAEARSYPALALAASRGPLSLLDQSGQQRRPSILPMWQQEQRIIEEAIANFSGNIALAAAALQLSPSTIYRKRQSWAEAESGSKGAA